MNKPLSEEYIKGYWLALSLRKDLRKDIIERACFNTLGELGEPTIDELEEFSHMELEDMQKNHKQLYNALIIQLRNELKDVE